METALVTRGSLFAGFRRRQIRLAVPGSRSGTHCDPDDREGNQGGNLGAAPELSPRAILDADTREDLRGKSLLLGHKGLVTHTVSVSLSSMTECVHLRQVYHCINEQTGMAIGPR